jgi:DNA recombination protein RmuC
MYIPSESVFYEIASADELMEYARTRRVYPVSPNTLYASLQTILLSFEGRKIETKAKEVFQLMRAISKDYEATETTLSTLGSHLNNATNKFSELEKNITSIGHKLDTTHSLPDSTLPDKNKLT